MVSSPLTSHFYTPPMHFREKRLCFVVGVFSGKPSSCGKGGEDRMCFVRENPADNGPQSPRRTVLSVTVLLGWLDPAFPNSHMPNLLGMALLQVLPYCFSHTFPSKLATFSAKITAGLCERPSACSQQPCCYVEPLLSESHI